MILSRSQAQLNRLLALNDWEPIRRTDCLELLQLSQFPDNGSGLAGQAMLIRNILDDELCKRKALWQELMPDEDWPNLQSVGVWTDDYSNLFSVFSWR